MNLVLAKGAANDGSHAGDSYLGLSVDLDEARLVGVAGVQLYAHGAVHVNRATDADGTTALPLLDWATATGVDTDPEDRDPGHVLLDLDVPAGVTFEVSGSAALAAGDPDAAGTAEVQQVSLGEACRVGR